MQNIVRALVVVLAVATLSEAVAGPPRRPGTAVRPPGADMRSEARVSVGDAVPELGLVRPEDGSTVQLGAQVTQGRPLVLIFGSFT